MPQKINLDDHIKNHKPLDGGYWLPEEFIEKINSKIDDEPKKKFIDESIVDAIISQINEKIKIERRYLYLSIAALFASNILLLLKLSLVF